MKTYCATDHQARAIARLPVGGVIVPETIHVDEWLDNVRWIADPHERYTRLFLEIHRMPAAKLALYEDYVDKPITCEWKGSRYRLTGASRYGDVFLNADLCEKGGYTRRVSVTECSAWKVEGLDDGS